MVKMLEWQQFDHNWMEFSVQRRKMNSNEGFSRWTTCFTFTPDWLWQEVSVLQLDMWLTSAPRINRKPQAVALWLN